MISCTAHPAQGPPRASRSRTIPVSLDSHGVSGISRSSSSTTQSPRSLTLARHVDSCAGQVALRSHYLRGGDHAPQVPQVSACPVHSLKPPTSHGARARLTRLSQAAVASDIARVVTLMQPLNGLLVCNGSAAPRDEPQHLERLLSGGVTWPDRTIEAAVRRWHVGSVAKPVCASPVGPCSWLCGKSCACVGGPFSRVRATLTVFLGALA